MKVNFSKVIKYAISLAFAGILLYFSFRNIDFDKFFEGFRQCNNGFIFLAMAVSVAAAFLRSLRWRTLMRPFDDRMQVLTAFNGVNIGYLANFVFPRIGEIVRCGFVSRRSHSRHCSDGQKPISFEQAVGTVLLSRTWDVVVVFLLVALLMATRWEMFGEFFTASIIKPVEERLNIGAWEILAIAAAAVGIVLFIIFHFRSRSRILERIADFCKGIGQGFYSFFGMKRKGWFLIYTVGMWAMYWLMSMCIIWAMPQMGRLGAIDAWFLCLAGSVAWMVPVPGGFGAYHFIVALAVSKIYGFAWEDGMLYATLNHETQAIVMLVCGMASYISEVFRSKKTGVDIPKEL